MQRFLKQRFLIGLAPLFLASSLALGAERGQIVIIGHGEAKAEADYGQLVLTVTSICYDKASEAREANDVLANDLVASLRSFATDERDEVTAQGGGTFRSDYSYWDGGQLRYICRNKWQASNTLTIKKHDIAQLSDLQDALLANIDSEAVNPNLVAQTYANLSQPSFGLNQETFVKLRAAAQDKAYRDAKMQLAGFSAACPFRDLKLDAVVPPGSVTVVGGDRMEHEAGADSSAQPTPIDPGELSVAANWKFVWTFEPMSECKRLVK